MFKVRWDHKLLNYNFVDHNNAEIQLAFDRVSDKGVGAYLLQWPQFLCHPISGAQFLIQQML